MILADNNQQTTASPRSTRWCFFPPAFFKVILVSSENSAISTSFNKPVGNLLTGLVSWEPHALAYTKRTRSGKGLASFIIFLD